MNTQTDLPKYSTRKEIDKFNQLLNLKEDPFMQDWEIELADGNRLGEFIDCYHTHAKTSEEKFTLMALIIASFDDYFAENDDIAMWGKIKSLLLADRKLFEPLIKYWCVWEGGDNPEYYFEISPLMRELSKNEP